MGQVQRSLLPAERPFSDRSTDHGWGIRVGSRALKPAVGGLLIELRQATLKKRS